MYQSEDTRRIEVVTSSNPKADIKTWAPRVITRLRRAQTNTTFTRIASLDYDGLTSHQYKKPSPHSHVFVQFFMY